MLYIIIFFFSSRRPHTCCSRDWSSDVCSSDLAPGGRHPGVVAVFLPHRLRPTLGMAQRLGDRRIVEGALQDAPHVFVRSRKRRKVGDSEAQDLAHVVLLPKLSYGENRLRTNREQAQIVGLGAKELL